MAVSAASYLYKSREFASEEEMVRYFLDDYRCVEDFAAQYLSAWQRIATTSELRGGLRTVSGRERLHAEILAARLHELGGTPQCTVSAERLPALEYYGSMAHSDRDKLRKTATRLQNAEKVLAPLTLAIGQIEQDRESRMLLETIMDDERASIAWFVSAWHACEQA